MPDMNFMIRFKPSEIQPHSVIASIAEIHGDHLALVNSNGDLSALFLLDIIKSLSTLSCQPAPLNAAAHSEVAGAATSSLSKA